MSTQDQNVVLNMRVTANSTQGHRKYMEDCYKIRFQRESTSIKRPNPLDPNNNTNSNTNTNSQESDILFSYFAIFDGHGGKEASQFCKEKLYWKIIESDDFWSDNDSQILNAIRNGFIQCHLDMWNELPGWPKTGSGLPSTSGSTATIMFIKKSKAYVGHVGDSGLVIGYNKAPSQPSMQWSGKKLTRDHKPEDPVELKRIQSSGGSVMSKSGVNRVVWNRPVFNPAQPNSNLNLNLNLNKKSSSSSLTPYEVNYLRSQQNVRTERVPFLAVARSLGDLWSYDVGNDEFIVSPVPDVFSFDLDPRVHKCLILATDGLWNVLKASECVELVRQTDKETENLVNRSVKQGSKSAQPFVNPSQRLVNTAMQRCCEKMIRADNTSCITIMLDQPEEHNDFDFNLTQDIMNKTNFEKLLKQNKTFDKQSRRGNDSDQFDEDYDELEDDEEEENDDEDEDEHKMTKTFSGQMLASSTMSEFNTPLDSDKRSRSLISLRRRHWSGTASCNNTNASSKHADTTVSNTNANKRNQFINIEDRNRRLNNNNNFLNKTTNLGGQHKPIYDTNNPNRANQKTANHHKSNLNVSSVSTINRFSKNLRKSFNDLYTATSNKLAHVDDSSKENKDQISDKSPSNRYTKRLKRFKNRLIKTKNNFLSRKRKLFGLESPGGFNSKNNCKSVSSPNLRMLDKSEKIRKCEKSKEAENDLNLTSATNQSFVNNMKFKLHHLKRNRSAKLGNDEHLNSTTLTAKLSATSLSNKNRDNLQEHTPSKRPKFY